MDLSVYSHVRSHYTIGRVLHVGLCATDYPELKCTNHLERGREPLRFISIHYGRAASGESNDEA